MRRHDLPSRVYELLSSMRFAVSLLVLLAIASVIGTLLEQNLPYTTYIENYGLFWFTAFQGLGLLDVYHSPWYLLILLFLTISTSLCVLRHVRPFLRDMRSFRLEAQLSSLQAMRQHVHWTLPAEVTLDAARLQVWMRAQGLRVRHKTLDAGWLLAAKRGTGQRLGYFFAHIAIVLITLGGLLDSNIWLQLRMALGQKVPESRNLPESQVPARSRLGPDNFSFRGNVDVPEGQGTDVLFLNQGAGYFVQELPFVLHLKKFQVEHYATGQPKSFVSDLVVQPKTGGPAIHQQIKVNEPLTVEGITIYQSSFGDGGSSLKLQRWPLGRNLAPLAGQSWAATSMQSQAAPWPGARERVEWGEFRLFNIEPLPTAGPAPSFWARAQRVEPPKGVHNLGPSISYKLRDASGQAREYINYMLPIALPDGRFMVSGMRQQAGGSFQYLRVPVDEQGRVDGFFALRARLLDPAQQLHLAETLAQQERTAARNLSPEMQRNLQQGAHQVLQSFMREGFAGLEQQLKSRVPERERSTVAEVYFKLLQALAMQAYREQRPAAAPALTEQDANFVLNSLLAMSGSLDYQLPEYWQLADFKQVQASGLQMTRSPGMAWVYSGSLLLVLGVALMFYWREERLWLWWQGGRLGLSLSSQRMGLADARLLELHTRLASELGLPPPDQAPLHAPTSSNAALPKE